MFLEKFSDFFFMAFIQQHIQTYAEKLDEKLYFSKTNSVPQ